MPTTSAATTPTATTTAAQKGLLQSIMSLLGSAQSTLDNGIKTDVSVTFPSSVYFDIFALVVFCSFAIVGINWAASALKK